MTKKTSRTAALRTLTVIELSTVTGGYDLLLQESMEKKSQLEAMVSNTMKSYTDTSNTSTVTLKSS